MGDLILTLPCDQLVKSTHEVHWAVPDGLQFVVDRTVPTRPFQGFKRDWSFSRFLSFFKMIREIKPDVSVSFHVPWWVNFALWLGRVKTRSGVLSQWHSYAFLNRGLRQKRSQCEHHEMDYNYLLVEHAFDLEHDSTKWKPVTLQDKNAKAFHFDTNQKYFVVHPGMGGSALNWPSEHYAKLIDELSQKVTVVITGTQSDEAYLTPLKKLLKENQQVVWLDKQLDGPQLLRLLKNAIANIAPSTGVLHLSASLGAASIGIFSPIRVHQDKRWGPKGPEVSSFSPEVSCPAHFECLDKECPAFFCMTKMSVQPVLDKALSYL
ncbi:MAG: glycosyltransferase family 9 protein [Pseudomonadota bacterium]